MCVRFQNRPDDCQWVGTETQGGEDVCMYVCVCMVVHGVAGLSFMQYWHLYICDATAQYLYLFKDDI